MLATLIIGLMAGPAVSLYGSPTVSPVTEAAWASEPLPPCAPSSISFFALSHAPPPAVIEIAKNRPTTITPISRPPSALTDRMPDDQRDHDRDQRRQDHLPLRRLRDDVDALRVVGLVGALHDPRLLAELAAHLLDHGAAGAADRLHRERGEQADHQAADQQADQHVRIVDEEHDGSLAVLASSSSSSIWNAANSTSAASAAEPIA